MGTPTHARLGRKWFRILHTSKAKDGRTYFLLGDKSGLIKLIPTTSSKIGSLTYGKTLPIIGALLTWFHRN